MEHTVTPSLGGAVAPRHMRRLGLSQSSHTCPLGHLLLTRALSTQHIRIHKNALGWSPQCPLCTPLTSQQTPGTAPRIQANPAAGARSVPAGRLFPCSRNTHTHTHRPQHSQGSITRLGQVASEQVQCNTGARSPFSPQGRAVRVVRVLVWSMHAAKELKLREDLQ